ncbi:MAG: glycoside hydrolase family 127 protein, partial [Proteiniphilum sp.]|nr:glycoside hydrolase family 127 protein [Proteiniphilum sp.]
GTVELSIDSIKRPIEKEIRLRIPGWCKKYKITINGEKVENIPVDKGFAVIDRKWKNSDRLTFTMDMPVEVVEADNRVRENIGKRAVQRGPLVYCIEEVDNESFDELYLTEETEFIQSFEPDQLQGVAVIDAITDNNKIRFIPYYAWDNREPGQMKVWINYKE